MKPRSNTISTVYIYIHAHSTFICVYIYSPVSCSLFRIQFKVSQANSKEKIAVGVQFPQKSLPWLYFCLQAFY